MTDELRQTGRTQRMLEAALGLGTEPRSITIIGSNEANCHNLKLRLIKMAKAQGKEINTVKRYEVSVKAIPVDGSRRWTYFQFSWDTDPTKYRGTLHILADHSVRDMWLAERQGWWDWEGEPDDRT